MELDIVFVVNMWYNYVGCVLIGGYLGQVGFVVIIIIDGMVVNYMFIYIVFVFFNVVYMYYVVLLIDQINGEIINVVKVIMLFGLFEVKIIDMNVFFNFVFDVVNVSFIVNGGDFEVVLMDFFGKMIFIQLLSNVSGVQFVKVNFDGVCVGFYLIIVFGNGGFYIQYVVVK